MTTDDRPPQLSPPSGWVGDSEVLLRLLRERPGWPDAIGAVRRLADEHGAEARERAQDYSLVYEGRRSSMVFDVVASRQRRYETRVQRMVERFEDSPASASLDALAELGPPGEGLRTGEGETMRLVAAGLARHARGLGLNDDDGVRSWAKATSGLTLAHRLDPYVGETKGIGIALFEYLRMRSGGDGIKPDIRVRKALTKLGFEPPKGEASLVVIAHAIADELDESLLVVDQLLWWE